MSDKCWCGTGHDINHGTSAGYKSHGKLRQAGHAGVEPCEPCKDAHALWTRDYRAGPGKDAYERSQGVKNCRERALRRLSLMHPRQMRELYRDELDKAGLATG